MKRITFILSVVMAFALLLSACAKPAPTEAPSVPEAPAATEAPVVTEAPAAPEEVTLVVWDQFYRDVESEVMETLNAEFEAAHPGVKIERVVKTLDDLKVTLKLALAQEDGPDVAQVNQGRSDMGAMVQADLLLPLNDYAAAYKWDERFSSSVASRNSFTPDGVTFGQGNLYGVSPTAEVVGVFYNKTIMDANGWTLPTTFDEFQTLLAGIKDAGMTPISFGSLDGWNAIHEFSAVQHLLVSLDYINDFVYGVNNVTFDTPENQEAARVMQDWVDKGYFSPDFAGIGYDDSNKLFKAGVGGVLTITGSWLAGELVGDTDQEFGFFLLPANPGHTRLAIGGVGIPFSIRKTTTKADLAAEYLDWMTSPRAAELWANAGMLPAMPLPEGYVAEGNPLFNDTLIAWDTINSENAVGHYIDWATPTFYDTIVAELQKLFGKVITPAEFTKAVEVDYAAFLAGN
ncbi:MAG TPA: extracellular solute-binding protein [Anaerolineaceae bacterium]|nr:extracellular solute-binding protein [Anaerolineaceae bacterium]HQF69311.1 extracellular solute-binding protein [Anaerolineaceae bacterium]HQK05265.1 extracellular solute-binding protein [Anaerolineaceae bacterium]HUM63351.1 extracellular solute-binding protein [Anaerolineaceae bacterium]